MCGVPTTGEARAAVLSFWHSFVEPFFGRGQRQYSPLHTQTQMQQLEAEDHVDKQSSSSDEQEEGKGECTTIRDRRGGNNLGVQFGSI